MAAKAAKKKPAKKASCPYEEDHGQEKKVTAPEVTVCRSGG